MGHSIEIQQATRKFIENGLNDLISGLRIFLDEHEKVYTTIVHEEACGEKALVCKIGADTTDLVSNIVAAYETDKKDFYKLSFFACSVLASLGKTVYLEDQLIENSNISDMFINNTNIKMFIKSVNKQQVIGFQEAVDKGEEYEIFRLDSTTDAGALVYANAICVLGAVAGVTSEATDGTKINGYGCIALFPEIKNPKQDADKQP